jgi:hypothetical protein
MVTTTLFRQTALIFLFSFVLTGCTNIRSETTAVTTPVSSTPSPSSPANSINPAAATAQILPGDWLMNYSFPASIETTKRYMFYLHGKIIENQGIPAIDPRYGEYEYKAILERLSGFGFVVISEQRPRNTEGVEYARRIARQVGSLINTGVPAKNITIVGASKGASIAIYVSHFLAQEEMRYVVMAICNPDTVEEFNRAQITLYGDVLSIYDVGDELAGSCQGLFAFSEGKGISNHAEIVLSVGTGHGILYHPLDEWILPTVAWASKP